MIVVIIHSYICCTYLYNETTKYINIKKQQQKLKNETIIQTNRVSYRKVYHRLIVSLHVFILNSQYVYYDMNIIFLMY